MLKINKKKLKDFSKAKNKVKLPKNSSAWQDSEISAIKQNIKKHILKEEQKNCCAYCEINIKSKNSHIDHFKTRNLYPENTLEYNNLLVSCNTKGRCADYKDKNIKTKKEYNHIVNPVIDDPSIYFKYLTTGEIIPINSTNSKGKFTIDIFQLNHKDLKLTRLKIAKSLNSLNLSLEEVNEIFPNFYGFIKDIHPKLK